MSISALSRRTLLRSLAGAGVLALGLTACTDDPDAQPGDGPPTPGSGSAGGRRFGAEWEKHTRTYLAWPSSANIWGGQLHDVQKDIAALAAAIGAHEPVVLLARPDQEDTAQQACGRDVDVIPLAVDDLWARDTLPVFVEEDGKVKGVDFNFSGWGNKQEHSNDGKVARALLERYSLDRIETPVVAEGGSFETDGLGTLVLTESSVVNANRNPGMSRERIEDELKKALGVTKVIWLAGVRGKDITDAHVDCLMRFVAPGTVLLDQAFPGSPADSWSRSADQAKSVLRDATDARGKPIEVIELPQPDPDRITGRGDAFVSSYLNFYIGSKGVYLPRFGDARADDRAQQVMKEHFPDREIVPVRIDAIAAGGGGIHCATHDLPALGG
ncbi:agmatine deiminase family protein [Kitasatospora paracochleata]|uniref:Agmatine deiminase n=1 Tax=Kitasatospora paracochleata TaxID=58354 RepID=A0ABT1IVK6_9ACTN|nr:agmatine deiminase family protein [Kitasatospora paracochleata]MCP2309168.1 agmatine deiminase [Kitasatospora paracochleata]